jgi:Sap, sulfolipid-1-addressing protein
MGQAVGGSLPLAVGVALSPAGIIVVVLLLTSQQARVNGPAFVLGWLVGLALIGAIVLSIAKPAEASSSGGPATWVSWLKIALGLLLLLVAWRQFRSRPRGAEQAGLPQWMGAIDTFKPGTALGAGMLLSAVSPKNLLLAVAAAAGIAQTGISGGQQAVAYLVFALIGAVGVAAPVVIFFAMGERSADLLAKLKDWMGQHNAVIMTVLCLIIGVKLIGDAIGALT